MGVKSEEIKNRAKNLLKDPILLITIIIIFVLIAIFIVYPLIRVFLVSLRDDSGNLSFSAYEKSLSNR